jgi:PhzF family phenazine biosynthesis protein
MNIPIYQVDAFTIKPFTGNPAAVCLLAEPRDEKWMQAVASEMNTSETAFLVSHKDGYNLRWFTPTTEINLCGHATLASAHILYEFGFYEEDEKIEFYTLSGTLIASQSKGFIELDMPSIELKPAALPAGLAEALGSKPSGIFSSEDFILALFEDEKTIQSLSPNIKLLKELPFDNVAVTAKANPGKYDFVSRFFAPRQGIDEDPVTGMAHCALGPLWGEMLGKREFLAFQASERTGEVRVRLGNHRVFVGGKAITVLRGDLLHQ